MPYLLRDKFENGIRVSSHSVGRVGLHQRSRWGRARSLPRAVLGVNPIGDLLGNADHQGEIVRVLRTVWSSRFLRNSSCPLTIACRLSEKGRRRNAAVEPLKLGHGGIVYIACLLGCDPKTIRQGMQHLDKHKYMRDVV